MRATLRTLALTLALLLTAAVLLPLAASAAEEDEDAPIVPIGQIEETEPATDFDLVESDDVTPEPTEEPGLTGPLPDETPVDEPPVDDVVTPEEPAPGSFYVNKHNCPDAILLLDFNELAAACDEQPAGIVFGASDGGGYVASQATGDVVAGAAILADLAPGPYSVVEEVPAGYGMPVVFCDGTLPGEEGQPASFVQMEVLDGTQIFWELGAGEQVFCDWFNFPPGEGDEGGSVEIHKYDCPAGYDPTGATYDDLIADCDEPMDGVHFGVSDGAAYVAEGDTGDAGEGSVAFDGLAAGAYSVVETLPVGYGAPVVFCEGSYPTVEDGGVWFQAMDILEGNQFFWQLGEGERLECDWFNFPPHDDDSDITIRKWACPEDIAHDADLATLLDECDQAMDGVDFHLETEAGEDEETTVGGAVAWDGLPLGEFAVWEEVPAGYGAPIVWCGMTAFYDGAVYDGFPARVEVTDATISGELAIPGTHYFCDWFNVPHHEEDDGDLTVIKYWCEGTATTLSGCERYGGGVEFLVGSASGEGDPLSLTTGAEGNRTVALPAGRYTLTEVGRQPCLTESAAYDAEGKVVVEAGEESVVVVYNCGTKGGPGKTPPVKRLPNTGSGATLDGPHGHGFGLDLGDADAALLVAAQAALVVLGLAARAARHRRMAPVAARAA